MKPRSLPTARHVVPPEVMEVVDPVVEVTDAASLNSHCLGSLKRAEEMLSRFEELDLSRPTDLTFEETLGRLDDVLLTVFDGSDYPLLLGVAHPDEEVRRAAKACEIAVEEFDTTLWHNRGLARAIEAYREKREVLNSERSKFLRLALADLRRSGIHLPEERQQRLRKINHRLISLGQDFVTSIGNSNDIFRIEPEGLRGMSDEFIRSHPPDDDGKITITTDYPDYFDFMTYADDRVAARGLYRQFVNRGGRSNVSRLGEILALRHEKARILGYRSWAEYAIEPRMAGSPAVVEAFLTRVRNAIGGVVAREMDQFKAEYRRQFGDEPDRLYPPERYYLQNKLAGRLGFDGRRLAEYFEVEAVTGGLLAVTSKMFGLTYRKTEVAAWHPSVVAYDVYQESSEPDGTSRKIGQLYLDLLSRDNKYKHAAMFQIRTGKLLAGGRRQTPVVALVCNFPEPGEPMPHADVVTYFHEFGHALHALLTQTELARFSGANSARDFIEIPAQLFEEWAWSREVLSLFARHLRTGEEMPPELYRAMTAARRVGLALATQRQAFLAVLDLDYHSMEPGFDSTAELRRVQQETFAFSYVPETHLQSSFSHLIGYDAGYYSYLWAMVFARDVFSRFSHEGLLRRETAMAWVDDVLSKGAAGDERVMLSKFLGRPPSEQAFLNTLRDL